MIDVDPKVIVVEPLITPDTTISLLGEVSTDRKTAGFAALPEADQSLEFFNDNLLLSRWSNPILSSLCLSSLSISGFRLSSNREAIIKTTETKLKGFVVSMADTIYRCHRKVINPSQNPSNFYSIFVSRDKISLSPLSMTVIVDTANGLPQAMPNSRFTSLALCLVTPG